MASRSTSFLACRSVMFSQSHNSSSVSMRTPNPCEAPAVMLRSLSPDGRSRVLGLVVWLRRVRVSIAFARRRPGPAAGAGQVVGVVRGDLFPPEAVGVVGCRKTEHVHQPL